ncbi:unnamed protein product [Closterium sp. NIES-53]
MFRFRHIQAYCDYNTFRVRQFRPAHCQVFTSPRSLQTWVESVHTRYRASSGSCVCSGVIVKSGSRLLLVSPPVAPDSSVAPPPGSPLPATPSWHALPSSCVWSTQVFASRPALAQVSQTTQVFRADLPVLVCTLTEEPCVSLPETSPKLCWTREVGNASVFRVWGSCAFVRDISADKLSARAIPCVFLGFVTDVPGWQFYHPTSRRVLPFQDVTGATGAGGAGDAGARGAGVIAGVGGAGVGGTGAGGAGVAGAGAVYPGAGGARGTVRPRPYFVPLLQQVIGVVSSPSLTPFLLCPPPDQSQPPLLSASPLPAPSPYTEQSGNLIERRELASRPVSPLHTSRRVPRSHPPPVPGMHAMALRLLAIAVTDPSFESAATSARVAELLDFATACRLNYASALVAMSATASPPSVGGECALGTDILEDRQEDFESLAAAGPGFASMLLAPEEDPDAPDIPTPSSYAEAITGPNSSHRQAAMDAEMASWKSTSTYVDEVPPPRANIVDGMWIFRGNLHEEIWLRRLPGFTGTFSAGTQWSLRRPVYGLRQAPREWHDTLRTILAALGFAPSSADPSLVLRIDTLLLPFYGLVYVDDFVFATADTEALTLVKSELQKRHTCTDLGKLRSYLGLQITRDTARRTITLTQSHMVHQVLQRFGFQFSSPQPTPLSTSHSLSAPPSDKFVEPSGPYPELVGCLMYLMTCTRPDLAYPPSLLARYVALGRHRKVHWDAAKRVLRYLCSTSGMGLALGGRGPVVLTAHADASWVDDSATQRSSQGYTFSLGSGSVSLQSTCSSSILTSSCDTQIYAGAIAAQELRWLTYLLTDF